MPPLSGLNLLAQQLRMAALEAEATRFQRFARDAPIGILFIASDGTAQFANDEYLRIVGRSSDEFEAERFRLAGSALPDFLDPALGPRHAAECVRPDGTRVPILVGISAQEDGLAAFVLDLTAEKAAERALQESEERCRAIAARLEEEDRRKDEFLGVLSHELRNPLAPIRNALHLLSHGGDDPGRAARAREVIERQVGHLSRLVDDLLDVTRITRGRIELHRVTVDLARIVRETVEDHRAGLEAAGVRVVLQLPPAPTWVEGDPTRLAQILGNLLLNSARFTPPGGTVTVQLEDEAAGSALLSVRDTGEGIDADVLGRIFEPFSQADRSLARTRGGLGLGLAIVKGLVELHGGSVTVSSAGRGAGTEVSLRLPCAPAVVSTPTPRPAAPRAAHVLVIEDNVDAAETVREALELEGMRVAVAGDGAAGLAAVRRLRPDLVICDIGLPGGLDGYDVARAIRADPALRDTPLITLTGYAGPEDRARAREAGFDLHLGKPTGIDDLLRAVSSVVPP
ncbi:ATP-binding response regulator [Anaeromyxobacter oryzisoli]|uniref:ATP-binding response regulator n=1 Tax=Anaeromyxobacter oryzisoli TaxID=2925408 RepID=UPI001F59E565|nr:hybrid sensor histidine kinase/response regulator [Anaeromyxobacter sp. SG63]